MEFVPRTRTLAPAPGIPLFVTTATPAALPCSEELTVTVGAAGTSSSSPSIEATAPDSSRFTCVPYPVTTTRSSSSACGCRRKVSSTVSPPITVTLSSCVPYPRILARTVCSPTGTPVIRNRPFVPVTVP